MRVIQNKEEIISYYQLTKTEKIIGDVPKLGRNLSKLAKNGKKLVKKIGIMCILTLKNT